MPTRALLGLFLFAATLATAAPAAAAPMPAYVRRALGEVFRVRLDTGGDGRMDLEEARVFLTLMDPHEGVEGPTAEQAAPMLRALDADGSGDVSLEELLGALAAFPWPAENAAGDPAVELHLAPTSRADEVRVMWVAHSNYTAGDAPAVRYGLAAGKGGGALNLTAPAATTTYDVGSGWHGTIFSAVAGGLLPGARYRYQVGAPGQWSADQYFTATGAASPANVSWAMYGDMGVVPAGWYVMKMLVEADARDPFDTVLHVGDVAYAGVTSKGEFEPTWDVYGAQIQPLAARVPYATTTGNHEKYFNYSAFRHRYQMPGNETGGEQNYWFSYDFAGVHVTSMSTEHPYSPGSPQHDWLRRDMAGPAARAARWRVLAAHRPFLSSDADEYTSHRPGAPLITAVEPLLLANRYDLVETGHMHCAELALPSIGGKPVVSNATRVWHRPAAPAYVTQGNAGALIVEKWIQPQPEWSGFRALEYGYGRANFLRLPEAGATPCGANATDALHYQFMAKGGPQHAFWICK